MGTFNSKHTPAEIVKVFPKASDLFKIHQIDFCCGGDRPLKEAIAENSSIDENSFLLKLNTEFNKWKKEDHDVIDWDSRPSSELVDHITHTHHAYLMEELPALGEFVTRIFRVHGADQPHLKDLHRLYNEFKTEMEEHTIKEDQEVFPLIKAYEQQPSEKLLKDIQVANGDLEDEHDKAGDLLKEMRRITNGFTTPEGACGSYHITYDRLAEMEDNTFEHIHLENNILFKQFY